MPTAIEEPGADLETGDIGYAPSGGPGGAIDAGDIGHDPFSSARDFLGGPQPSPAAPQAPPIPLPPTQPNYGVDIQALPAPYQMTGEEAARRRQLEFIENVYNKLPPREAASVIEQATQLEGRLGYDEDLKAGVPPHEALAKWGPKLFHNAPAALLRALTPPAKLGETLDLGGGRTGVRVGPQHLQIYTNPKTGPIQGRPLLDENGNVVGNDFEGAHHPRFNTNKGGLTINNQITIARMKLKAAETTLNTLKYSRVGRTPEGKKAMADAMKRHAQLEADLEKIGQAQAGAEARPWPKPGEVINGHTYLGGHPNQSQSWEAPGGEATDYPEVNTDTEE